MTFDDGVLKIYKVINIAETGMKPKYALKLKSKHCFGFETVGISRYYTALQENVQVSDVVHIWEDRKITSMDICILEDGLQYKCAFVQHVMDDGLKITRITLEQLKEDYGIL